MKIMLEIPDESVCMNVCIGIQGKHGWGMASFQFDEELFEGSVIRLKAELNQEKPPKDSET